MPERIDRTVTVRLPSPRTELRQASRVPRTKRERRWSAQVAGATDRLLERGDVVRVGPPGGEHFARPDELLVHVDAEAELAAQLQEEGARRASDDARPRTGVVRYALPPGSDLHDVVARLREGRDGTGGVGPNAVLFGVPIMRGCPGRAPEPARALSLADGDEGRGIRVAVLDTGQAEASMRGAWESAHVSVAPGDVDPLDQDGDGARDLEAGHGTFVTGVVAQVAPGAEVLAVKALDSDGVTDDLTAAECVQRALDEGCQVLNLSFGGYTHDDRGLVALEAVLPRTEDVAVVAAAGNDSTTRRFWPAASEGVVSVGAVGVRRQRTSFTNSGDWVRACAEGDRLHSTYVEGTAATDGDGDGAPDHFPEAGAYWSGTSFAAPQVAAAVAVRAARTGEPAGLAAERLCGDPKAHRVPGLGTLVRTRLRGHPAPP
ncbi:MAG TPA: S8 family serine peptidase [Mycobacteriales bacterium]|nr:S8 family serine peptidase [Mycobacteriales bacterium]